MVEGLEIREFQRARDRRRREFERGESERLREFIDKNTKGASPLEVFVFTTRATGLGSVGHDASNSVYYVKFRLWEYDGGGEAAEAAVGYLDKRLGPGRAHVEDGYVTFALSPN